LDYVRNIYSKIGDPQNKNKEKSVNDLFEINLNENKLNTNLIVKVIEGTNEIHIYNKETKKLEKHKVELNVKKLNTKVFYKGCKSALVNGKVYISGGKDFSGDKTLFLVYNINEKKISRLHDMKYPRSFHSFYHHASMKALLAIGGENNNSCELYDFYLNMWNDFPELNYARANVEIIMNSNATLAYSLFGINGDIIKKQLSDVVEVIDMIDLNKGWYRVEYKNNTGVDVKSNCMTIYPLPDDKLLLFGGLEQRNPHPVYLVFDLKKLEMTKCDLMHAEKLKNNSLH